jgi:hypothetical protein
MQQQQHSRRKTHRRPSRCQIRPPRTLSCTFRNANFDFADQGHRHHRKAEGFVLACLPPLLGIGLQRAESERAHPDEDS